MRSMRLVVLLSVTLLVTIGHVGRSASQEFVELGAPTEPKPADPQTNRILGFKVVQDATGRWIADFDFVNAGTHVPFSVELQLLDESQARGTLKVPRQPIAITSMTPGQHHVTVEITRPMYDGRSFTTKLVTAYLMSKGKDLASARVEQVIKWPEFSEWMDERGIAGKGPEARLSRAVELIDSGGETSLSDAKRILERLLVNDPSYSPAFVELARVAMKTNWGPEGLHQAETLLDSALRLKPDNVNAKILLGYVYANQRKYKPAEALMIEAAKAGTTNLWNLANWGELLALQGKTDLAIQKYREALSHPRTDTPNDRARLNAYERVIYLLDSRKDLDGLESVYKQRAEEFGPGSCYSANYSAFMLQQRGNVEAAIKLARQAVEGICADQAARTALGMAYYVAWANTSDAQRLEWLNKARIYLPGSPSVLYFLAGNETTFPAAKQLVAGGEAIDQKDNYKYTALAYALQNKDYSAARRLLKLGAQPDTTIGPGEMPVALEPVVSGDIEGVRIMQKAGVNYAKLRYKGMSTVELARRSGNRKMQEALDPKNQTY